VSPPPRLVLASASPARAALLAAAGVRAEVDVSGVPEDDVTGSPAEVCLTLARRKAEAVVGRRRRGELVLGCDSVLDVDGAAWGKPGTPQLASQRWGVLAGRSAVLRTGHCLVAVDGGRAEAVASTTVRFGRPSPAEVAAYVASGEPLAVAGGFTLDGRGAWFVEGVDGDPSAVVGLSLPTLRGLLAALGVPVTDLWGSSAPPSKPPVPA